MWEEKAGVLEKGSKHLLVEIQRFSKEISSPLGTKHTAASIRKGGHLSSKAFDTCL